VAGTHFITVERMVPTGRMLAGYGMTSIMDIGTIPSYMDLERQPETPGGPPMGPMMMDPMMGYSAFPGMPEMVNILPARFADVKTTGLTAEVTATGTNEFLIDLHAEPPAEIDP
jgi:hypothetical protein